MQICLETKRCYCIHNTAASKSLKHWKWKCTITPAICLLLATLILPFGGSVFQFCWHLMRALPLSSLFDAAVHFTSWPMVLIVIIAIWCLDRTRSVYLIYLLCALLATSLINTPIKQLTGRSRPEWSVRMSKNKRAELAEFNLENTAFQVPLNRTDHWFGLRLDRPFFMDRYSSFPSGHAAAAFAMAAFLSILYPGARRLWLSAAVACALSRVYGERHFVEDILVGGAIGWTTAHWVFSWHWPLALQSCLVTSAGAPAVACDDNDNLPVPNQTDPPTAQRHIS